MKSKVFAGTSLALLLVGTLFIVAPVKPQFVGTIKIGVIGPMGWPVGEGILNGTELAAKQINDTGGIVTTETWGGGTAGAWKIEVVTADTLRGQPDPTYATGEAAAQELVDAGVDFVVGGFRAEAVLGIREVLIDSAIANGKPIFFIVGSTLNELIDCGDGTCGACVRCNYDRYKYVFRVTPLNSTMLFQGTAAYLKYVMVAKLMPIITGYASPLPIAVIAENRIWTEVMRTTLSDPLFWDVSMGMAAYGGVDVVNTGLVEPTQSDVSLELSAAETAGARLIIPILSGPVGRTMAKQFGELQIPALLSGINVPSQDTPTHWQETAGKCEFESFIAGAGTRTPITPLMEAFWDDYSARWEHDPIYTSYGTYSAVFTIKEIIEGVGKWPMGAEELVPHTEKTLRWKDGPPYYGTSMTGTFRYTGPHPMSSGEYDTYMANATHSYLDINPTMMGTLHDVFTTPAELGPLWDLPYYVRPIGVQWQKHPVTGEGRLEVVYPISMNCSRKIRIPPWMYSHADTDVIGALGFPDGYVNIYDLDLAAYSWLSSPGDAAWDYYGAQQIFPGLEADQDGNSFINIADISVFGKAWGYDATAEYGQWPLG